LRSTERYNERLSGGIINKLLDSDNFDDVSVTGLEIFSYQDRIDRKDVIRTYIYDDEQEYVIILEPQKGKKQILKKLKCKLPEVH